MTRHRRNIVVKKVTSNKKPTPKIIGSYVEDGITIKVYQDEVLCDEDDKWRRENILSVKRTDKYLSGDGRYVRKPEDNVSGKL